MLALSLPIDILSRVFLCCDVILSFQKKGEGFVPLKRLIPLQIFAPVQAKNLMYSSLCNLYVFLVSRFLYRLDRWFSRLNGFTRLVIIRALYSLLFGVNRASVLEAEHWPIMVYFYKLLFEWRVVSLVLIPHLPISNYFLISQFGGYPLSSSQRFIMVILHGIVNICGYFSSNSLFVYVIRSDKVFFEV